MEECNLPITTVDGLTLKEMFLSGAALLDKNRQAVDALNVFPVPDGDTGTNMSQTILSAARELGSRSFSGAGDVASTVAKGALKGARGNSGVILSQILRGIAKALEGSDLMDAPLLRQSHAPGRGHRLQGRHEAQGGHDPDRHSRHRRGGRARGGQKQTIWSS